MKTKPLSTAALAALSTATFEGHTLVRITAQLDRDVYVEVDKALQALGGRWNRKARAHVFPAIPETPQKLIEDVLANAGYVDKKKELQQFFTPAAVADLLVRLTKLRTGSTGTTVLEPSAGVGHILDAIYRLDPTYPAPVTAFEIDGEHVSALRRIVWLKSLAQVDFLKVLPASELLFDRIIMNPPFAKHADVEHVLHAWKFLAPGGRLVAVMSYHVTFATDATCVGFRKFASLYSIKLNYDPRLQPLLTLDDGQRAHFYSLPEKAFAESGTNVSTVVVVLEKP